uniref:Uncharacterized protein n=1 Tax=Arion vulgaris TaxID=1028688 RepID=A0A0B7BU29_9EUPU
MAVLFEVRTQEQSTKKPLYQLKGHYQGTIKQEQEKQLKTVEKKQYNLVTPAIYQILYI